MGHTTTGVSLLCVKDVKIWKTIGICLMLIIVVPVIVSILGMTMYSVNKDSNTVGEEYVEEEYVEVIETEDIGEFE